jgi:hypothetical protein
MTKDIQQLIAEAMIDFYSVISTPSGFKTGGDFSGFLDELNEKLDNYPLVILESYIKDNYREWEDIADQLCAGLAEYIEDDIVCYIKDSRSNLDYLSDYERIIENGKEDIEDNVQILKNELNKGGKCFKALDDWFNELPEEDQEGLKLFLECK